MVSFTTLIERMQLNVIYTQFSFIRKFYVFTVKVHTDNTLSHLDKMAFLN